jgi:hypothetical protein
MEIEENIEKLEKKVEKQSLAMELLEYSKEQNKQLERANKRLIGVVIFILILFGCTIGAFLYYINTTGYVETDEYSQEIKDIDSVNNSKIINGDEYGENNSKKKEN